MSDGATISAPASAWDTAILHKYSNVLSLSTYSPSKIPQCPWSVYSHIQTSVITNILESISLIFLTAFCTIPSLAKPSEPQQSLVLGIPKRITPLTLASLTSSMISWSLSNE